MQRNKYLDELGIPINEYGVNFLGEEDSRMAMWKKQKEEYGFDSRECWNLDNIFVQWLYSHLMMYKEEASRIVDLTFHKVKFDGKEYTQIEAINFIIEKCEAYLKDDRVFIPEEIYDGLEDACRLWGKILPMMWW